MFGKMFDGRMVAATAVSVVLAVISSGTTATSSAAPSTPSVSAVGPAKLMSTTMTTSQRARVKVWSPSMRRAVSVDVLLPRNSSKPRPTLYMLDGIDAGVLTGFRESGWTNQTDVVKFMANKDLNVVLPIGGTGSYYTDWTRTDPVLGVNKWETFLTSELPTVIDAAFKGNGVNAIEGVSMGATAAVTLAARHPELYRGVAAFSGCLDLLDPAAAAATQGSIVTRGGNPENMWGRAGNADWRAHDPASNVAALKGKAIYLAVGDGLPDLSMGLGGLASPVGGFLESGAQTCTKLFAAAARRAGVKVDINYRVGLHSWGYWARDLHRSWPTLVRALGLPAVDPADYR